MTGNDMILQRTFLVKIFARSENKRYLCVVNHFNNSFLVLWR